MNEQRRDFFKNSALGLATITLGAGLSLIPSNLERYVRGFIYTTVAVSLWIFTLPRGCMV